MIELLGTSHVSPQSIQRAQEAVQDYDIIGVELDAQRLRTLMHSPDAKPSFWQLVKAVGLSGALFAKIGHYVEHKIGASVGTTPGGEMKAAVIAAAHQQKRVALIDQPIQKTLQRFSQAFTWRVKWKLFKTAFKRTNVRFDVTADPDEETIAQLLAYVEKHVPELTQVLVHERNTYMARKLHAIQHANPGDDILAVVGAGHLPGLREELNRLAEQTEA